MAEFPLSPRFLEEDEITILQVTESGNLFFFRETQKYMALPFQTCPKELESPVYKLPPRYPSIELTPLHVIGGVLVLLVAFFIGRKTEKRRRAEERRKKKLLKREKYQKNEDYIEERAKWYFHVRYPNLPLENEESSKRKSSDEIKDIMENNESKMEHSISPEEFFEGDSALVPYTKTPPQSQSQDLKVRIEEMGGLRMGETRRERTFILNWPLLDPKFNLTLDFSLRIEDGIIRSLTTNNNVSTEAFNHLLGVLMEKYSVSVKKIGSRHEIEIQEKKKQEEELLKLKNIEEISENTKESFEVNQIGREISENNCISKLSKINENSKESDVKSLNSSQNSGKTQKSLLSTGKVQMTPKEMSSIEKENNSLENSSKKLQKPSLTPLNEIKNKFAEKIENSEKSLRDTQISMEVKHFQFELFENGRFSKLFNCLQEIGKGAFGEVYKVIHKIENSIYAIKKVYLPLKVDEDIRTNRYFREVMLMTKFNHKNVIRYHTSWIEEPENDFKEQYLARKKEEVLKQKKREKKRSATSSSLNDIEEHKDEDCSNLSNHERTNLSSLGFEWVASNNNPEKTIATPKRLSRKFTRQSSRSQSMLSSSSSRSEPHKTSVRTFKNSRTSQFAAHWSGIIDKMKADQIPVVLFIQMHYSRQSLRNYLDLPTRQMDRNLNFHMFRQMIEGIKYIHANGIIHRDIKPANIFVDEDNTILIGDFGLSVVQSNLTLSNTISQGQSVSSENAIQPLLPSRNAQSLTKNVGTPLYLAPEQEKTHNYDEKVDIYALGLILLEMCTFIKTGHERMCIFNDIRKSHKLPESLRKNYGPEAEMVLLMTNEDPKKRPSSGEIEKCAEFKTWKEIVNKK